MTPLRVGLIGCGMIGRFHAQDAEADERLRLVAYADIRIEAARAFLAEYGGDRATSDPQELIADDSLDVVIVATHHDSHRPLTVAAARAGRHVLVEKPMALTVEDCDMMLEAADASGIQLAVNYKFRLEPAVRRARSFVPNPRLMAAQLAMPPITSASADHWVFDPARGGGLVIATGTHLLDLLSWFAVSEPIRVAAAGVTVSRRGPGLYDGLAGTVTFASGAVATVTIGNVGESRHLSKWSCQLYGGDRSATLYDRLRQVELVGPPDPPAALRPQGAPASMLSSLADAILTGGRVEADGFDGRRATLLATTLVEAARTSTTIELR